MGITREIATHCLKSATWDEGHYCCDCPVYSDKDYKNCAEDVYKFAIAEIKKIEKIEQLFERPFAKKVFECGMETELESRIKEVLDENTVC